MELTAKQSKLGEFWLDWSKQVNDKKKKEEVDFCALHVSSLLGITWNNTLSTYYNFRQLYTKS